MSVKNLTSLEDVHFPLLKRLDTWLKSLLTERNSAQESVSSTKSDDLLSQLSGVYLDSSTVFHLLESTPKKHKQGSICGTLAAKSCWKTLASRFGLSSFECDILLIAFAIEVDRKYEKIYSFLNDDIAAKRPTSGLVFSLFNGMAATKNLCRSLASDSKLVRFALIDVFAEDHSRYSWSFRLTSGILRYLLGDSEKDSIYGPYLAKDNSNPENHKDLGEIHPQLKSIARTEKRILVSGRPGVGKSSLIADIARERKLGVLTLDLERIARDSVDVIRRLGRIIVRDAFLAPNLLHFVCDDPNHLSDFLIGRNPLEENLTRTQHSQSAELRGNTSILELRRALLELPPDTTIVVEASGSEEIAERIAFRSEYRDIRIPIPDYSARRSIWSKSLESAGWNASEAGSESSFLAASFRLSAGQIESAVRHSKAVGISRQSIRDSAGFIASMPLEGICERIEPNAELKDLVIGDFEQEQLLDLIRRVRYREKVIEDWGFERKLSYGKGVNALFAGPSGTGKTMAAEALANELHFPLFRIECASVISKYIGETEKNLERIFHAAEHCDAVIFFDEADALFGKRTQVSDAHDRYANIETSYLLQRIERHEGMVVLATNLLTNIDSAFLRRITQIVHFRSPDAESRLRIWSSIWPERMPVSDRLLGNLPGIARHFDINGGSIKNAALSAAFLAASTIERENRIVDLDHVLSSITLEYRKLGRSHEKYVPKIVSFESPKTTGGVM